jgi:hypothetical protein
MPRIGPCPSCGTPEGWPHTSTCERASRLRDVVLPKSQQACLACLGTSAPHDPWCAKRPVELATEHGVDRCGNCNRAFPVYRGMQTHDLCPACRLERDMMLKAPSESPKERLERFTANVYAARHAEAERQRLYGEVNAASRALSEKDAQIKSLYESLGIEATLRVASAVRAQELSVLLRRALPMLADLVPKFPDAEKLCGEIKAILDGAPATP